jgi:hypothetical protein
LQYDSGGYTIVWVSLSYGSWQWVRAAVMNYSSVM